MRKPGKKKRGKDNIPILLYTESEENKEENQNQKEEISWKEEVSHSRGVFHKALQLILSPNNQSYLPTINL